MSPSGRFVASGQVGTVNYKGNAAPVILWRTDSGDRLGVLRGLSDRANILAFSPDERFLCGCGEVINASYPFSSLLSLLIWHYLGWIIIYLGYCNW